MATQQAPSSDRLEQVTREATTPKKDGGFESTYARVMKRLTQSLYNVPENQTKDNPAFIGQVLLDARAAILKSKVKNGIDVQTASATSGDISATLMKMQGSKATTAYHAKYAQDFAPMQADVTQRTLDHEKLREEIDAYINKLHTTMTKLDKELEENKMTPRQAESELAALAKEGQALEARAEKLSINMDALVTRLTSFHHEAYVMLPDKTGLNTPTTIAAPATEKGPSASKGT